jgi:hypothetical protein
MAPIFRYHWCGSSGLAFYFFIVVPGYQGPLGCRFLASLRKESISGWVRH